MLREILNSLSESDKQFLQIAFEDGNCLMHPIDEKHYICVNCEPTNDYTIIEKAGAWVYCVKK